MQVQAWPAHESDVTCIVFVPDNALLISGSKDNTIKVWELGEGGKCTEKCTLRGHDGAVNSITLSCDCKYLASAGDDKTVRLWEIFTGQQIAELRSHEAGVKSVAWSRDGSCIVSGSLDGTVHVWKVDFNVRLMHGNPCFLCARLCARVNMHTYVSLQSYVGAYMSITRLCEFSGLESRGIRH
jgi:WD40 repeat protein